MSCPRATARITIPCTSVRCSDAIDLIRPTCSPITAWYAVRISSDIVNLIAGNPRSRSLPISEASPFTRTRSASSFESASAILSNDACQRFPSLRSASFRPMVGSSSAAKDSAPLARYWAFSQNTKDVCICSIAVSSRLRYHACTPALGLTARRTLSGCIDPIRLIALFSSIEVVSRDFIGTLQRGIRGVWIGDQSRPRLGGIDHPALDQFRVSVRLDLALVSHFQRGKLEQRLELEGDVRIDLAELIQLDHVQNALQRITEQTLLLGMDVVIEHPDFAIARRIQPVGRDAQQLHQRNRCHGRHLFLRLRLQFVQARQRRVELVELLGF